jgi:Cdc6-like AAA superfamily ATPase
MVPYQRNANFTGRADLLTKLSTKLCDIIPKSWNHRVALYGLGGVGKTQLALEYVYAHKGQYDRVY